jgi:hypothetical protein
VSILSNANTDAKRGRLTELATQDSPPVSSLVGSPATPQTADRSAAASPGLPPFF